MRNNCGRRFILLAMAMATIMDLGSHGLQNTTVQSNVSLEVITNYSFSNDGSLPKVHSKRYTETSMYTQHGRKGMILISPKRQFTCSHTHCLQKDCYIYTVRQGLWSLLDPKYVTVVEKSYSSSVTLTNTVIGLMLPYWCARRSTANRVTLTKNFKDNVCKSAPDYPPDWILDCQDFTEEFQYVEDGPQQKSSSVPDGREPEQTLQIFEKIVNNSVQTPQYTTRYTQKHPNIATDIMRVCCKNELF